MQCLNRNSNDRPSCKDLKSFIDNIKKITPKISVLESNFITNKQVSKPLSTCFEKSQKIIKRSTLPDNKKDKNTDASKTVMDISRFKTHSLFETTKKIK